MVKSKKWEVSPMCECCSSSAHVHTDTLKVEGMSCSHCQAAIEKSRRWIKRGRKSSG